MTSRLRPHTECTPRPVSYTPLGTADPLCSLALGIRGDGDLGTTGDRITIRALTKVDAVDYHFVLSNPMVVAYDDFETISGKEALADVLGACELYKSREALDSKEEFCLAIDYHEDGKEDVTPGFVFFTDEYMEGWYLKIGYHLHPRYHGKGIARTAVGALVAAALARKVRPDYMKAYDKYQGVMALVYSGNARSIHLLESLGFVRDRGYEIARDVKGTPMIELRYLKTR
jgi:RimJ/RimL family protein N-acetyltransferase